MKKIILLVSLAFLVSCGPHEKKRYTLQVMYMTGETDTLVYKGLDRNIFRLENGDLREVIGTSTRTLISGVRQFKVLSIESLGFTEKPEDENFTNQLTLQ